MLNACANSRAKSDARANSRAKSDARANSRTKSDARANSRAKSDARANSRAKSDARANSRAKYKPKPGSASKQKIYGRPPGGHLTPSRSPSTLDANISAHNGSLVSAPAFSNNTVAGDLNIYFGKKDVAVTQNTAPLSSEDKPLAPEASSDIDSFMETIHRTPTKLQNQPLGSPGPHKTKGLHTACRSDVPRRKLSFGDVQDQDQPQPQPQLQLAPDEGYVEDRVSFSPSGPTPNCIMGEIIGARVRAEYLCCKCGTAALRVKADSFSVKCARCKHSWKCAKLQCRCTAEITVEQSDGTMQTIELSDSLLRSIVHFNSKGYCKTYRIEKRVLKVGSIRVDCTDGHPVRSDWSIYELRVILVSI
ncbi:hypothetical protein NFI96_009217 [Prochilodus magdalenae]|nr:hypothetical protein NFI96_009217 [Prochilodus magdalenae]